MEENWGDCAINTPVLQRRWESRLSLPSLLHPTLSPNPTPNSSTWIVETGEEDNLNMSNCYNVRDANSDIMH